MDPLSVTASIAGLIAITAQLSSTLKYIIGQTKDAPDILDHIRSEVDSVNLALQQLRELIYRKCFGTLSKPTLITLEKLLAILASSMITFSDLERAVSKFKSSGKMSLQQRILWVIKADSVGSLLERVQHHKSSLLFMLSIAQAHSQLEADQAAEKLQRCVEQLLADNDLLKERLSSINIEQPYATLTDEHEPASTIDPEVESRRQISEKQSVSFDLSGKSFSFETELLKSSVYSRNSHRAEEWSLSRQSLTTGRQCQSILSGISLSNISNLATFPVPVFANEITNASSYRFSNENTAANIQHPKKVTKDSSSGVIGKSLDVICKQAGTEVDFRDFRSNRHCRRRVPIILATIADFILSHNIIAGALRKFPLDNSTDEIPLEQQNKVSRLVKLFNTPPYTVNLEQESASLEDAIYCLIYFLTNLPQPLIPESCENLTGSSYGATDDFHASIFQENIRRKPLYGDVSSEMRTKIQKIIFKLDIESQDTIEFILYLIYQLTERNIVSGNIHEVASIFTPFLLPRSFLSDSHGGESAEAVTSTSSSSRCLTCVCVMMALRLRNEVRIEEIYEVEDPSAGSTHLQPAYVGVDDGVTGDQLTPLHVVNQKQSLRNSRTITRWFSVSQQPGAARSSLIHPRPPGQNGNFGAMEAQQVDESKFKKYNSEPRIYRSGSLSSRSGQAWLMPKFLGKLGLPSAKRS